MPRLVFGFWICLACAIAAPLCAVETVQFHQRGLTNGTPLRHGGPRTVVGEILVEAQDGGLMLQSDDGRIWTIQPDQIVDRRSDDRPLVPITAEEIELRMLDEMPDGFTVYRTADYVIVHNTNEAYVREVGLLFQQLHRGFYTYWKNQRWDLPDPRFPLVALVFADRDDFLRHASEEIGQTAESVIGYYHLSSNRMTTFHVPNLERNVATIIHEATHQLAYNSGVQTRFADNPMWVSEGLATFFESPDLSNPRKWRSIGRVNQVNLARWRKYLPRRPEESLATLLADDRRYRNSASAVDAYAEGWALTYFLVKTRRQQYVQYLQRLSEGRPLAKRTKRERIEMFEDVFGTTVQQIDRALVHYMRRVR
jgi:hypothetical protein